MILDQIPDVAIFCLLLKTSDVYGLIMEEKTLAKVPSMLETFGLIAQQLLECADFIVHYSEIKSFCE
jgi:hypothetical protein